MSRKIGINNLLLSGKPETCCLCLHNVDEETKDLIYYYYCNEKTQVTVKDEIALGGVEGTRVFHEILLFVLGDEIAYSVTQDDSICWPCQQSLIDSYKFIKMCKENLSKRLNTVNNLSDALMNVNENINNEDIELKSIFITINTAEEPTKVYYDYKKLPVNQNFQQGLYYERLQHLIKESELVYETDYQSDFFNDSDENTTLKTEYFIVNDLEKPQNKSQSIKRKKINNEEIACDEELRKCKFCLKTLSNTKRLRLHYYRNHVPKDVKCSVCSKAFSNNTYLNEHFNCCHVPAICCHCGKKFANKKYLQRHEAIHFRTECQKSGSKMILKTHSLVEKRKIKKIAKKSLNKSKSTEGKNINIEDIACDKELRKCKFCFKTLADSRHLRSHYNRKHAPKEIKCSLCSKAFSNNTYLNEHIDNCHVPAICCHCGKKFANKKYSKRHEETAHFRRTITAGQQICQKCGKSYKNINTLKKHICVIGKQKLEKVFPCNFCNKKFGRLTSVRKHVIFEHEGKGYNCNWCGKNWPSRTALKTHMVTHTQEKNFPCEICGGKFVSKASLLYHTRIHTGERPYKCDICDKSFLSASRRMDHMRRKHLEPKFMCNVCGGKFRSKACLRRHVDRHSDPKSTLYLSTNETIKEDKGSD